METEFTPISSLLGGGLIGLSAVILMAVNGRIAGISGIVSKVLPPKGDKGGLVQSLWLLLGLVLAAPLYRLVTGITPEQVIATNGPLLIMGGLLVGFGSVLGNGCTSGHGVCGISRGSKRSISATFTFMTTAFISVLILRHLMGA